MMKKNKYTVEKVVYVLDKKRFFVIETDYEYVHYAINEHEVQ